MSLDDEWSCVAMATEDSLDETLAQHAAAVGAERVRAVEVLDGGDEACLREQQDQGDEACLREQQDRDYEACLREDRERSVETIESRNEKRRSAKETARGWPSCGSVGCGSTTFKTAASLGRRRNG